MASESTQYLRLGLDGVEFLLPSEASLSIEQRDNLVTTLRDADGAGNAANVTAWYVVRSERWPAFYLGGDLRPSRGAGWQRAIFLEGGAHPIGLIADEVQLLPRSEMRIEPFQPLGPAPTPAGAVFDCAWMRGDETVFVFNPKALVAYLKRVWEGL